MVGFDCLRYWILAVTICWFPVFAGFGLITVGLVMVLLVVCCLFRLFVLFTAVGWAVLLLFVFYIA